MVLVPSLRLQQIACTLQAALWPAELICGVGRTEWVAHSTVATRSEQMACFSGAKHEVVCARRAPESRAFQKDAGDPNERRTENEKKQLLATLRAGGLERGPLKRAKQERARNCNLMSVVSGLGSLWKRVGRVGFPPFEKLEVWTQP
jgi:hypothetical protein